MLTDYQLTELCNKMDIPLEGVYFKDELPRKLKFNKSYIVNMEDSIDDEGNENPGSHWCCLQINKYPNGKIEPFWFDSMGVCPPEIVKKIVLNFCGQKLPYNTKDIQSMMNSACGFYCCALLHYINACPTRSRDMYFDIENFLEMFDDLNKSVDFKKNEYILKHFFVPKDPALRKAIEIDVNPSSIISEDSGKGLDMMQIPVEMKMRS
jgi:hypothetical protein